ncbi:MAG TPA: hypothetical protein VNE58_02080 [Casimicrobiaceae bacterium]|nr:hypothetical protein [Casimicrobiaceae bacterium]
MSALSHSELHQRIKSVERRLERRRARLLDDFDETVAAAGRIARKGAPIVAAVTAGLIALYFTRRRATRVQVPSFSAFRARFGRGMDEPTRRSVRWASIAGTAGTVLKIVTSPQARALWNGFKRGRQYRRSA